MANGWHRNSRTRRSPLTTTQRGLGSDHQKRRKTALAALIEGTPCPFCGNPMTRDMQLDLDHGTPLRLGGNGGDSRLAHRACNRRAGAKLANAVRRSRRGRLTSRAW